jgi:hypothetical protein
MSSGFNTDVRVGDHVFHVQTEDRGPSHPIIDTAIYLQGRVVHRRSTSYEHLNAQLEFNDDALHKRVAEQHRYVMEELRAGALSAEIAVATASVSPAGAIQARLLNPKAWLSAGHVSLDVEILRRSDHEPQPGVEVEASIEGALFEGIRAATSDQHGRVRIEFPLPPLGKGDLALVIRAKTDVARDEIRFSMRSRHTPPADPTHPNRAALAKE